MESSNQELRESLDVDNVRRLGTLYRIPIKENSIPNAA